MCGLFLLPVALALALLASPVTIRDGDIVTFRDRVRLLNGTALDRGWTARVTGVDVINGTPVVEVADPQGESHWVSRRMVRLAGS